MGPDGPISTTPDGTIMTRSHTYEIKVRLNSREWLPVTEYIWRSWGGPRKFNGRRYRGPVYTLGTMDVAEPATTMAWEAV